MTEGELKNKLFQQGRMLQIFVLLLFLLFVVLMVGYVQYNVAHSMEYEQLVTLETVSEKVTANMVDYFDRQWSHLDYVAETMAFGTYQTQADVLNTLAQVKRAHGLGNQKNLIILIDESGYYYTSDAGKVALWSEFTSSTGYISKDTRLMLNNLAELEDHQEQYICFVKYLDEPIVAADGSCFPYIVLATDEKVFQVDVSMGEFGSFSEAFVIASNGRKISTQTGSSAFSNSYNILSALQRAEFMMGDSYEQTLAKIEHVESGCSLIQYQDKRYYIAHHAMGIEDWNAMYIVESNQMVNRITPLIYRLVFVLSAGFFLLFLLIVWAINVRNKERLLNERLRATTAAAESANKAKSSFLSRMSHDIRTPLNGIIGMTTIAKRSLEDKAAVAACLEKISVASDHLLELVNEGLDLSRIENGKLDVQNAPVDLCKLLENMSSMNDSRIASKKQIYQLDLDGLLHPAVITDKTILNQILLNIVGNAVKYTPDGGTIRCTVYDKLLEGQQAEYHFVVSDTGIGMSQEFLAHIFEQFAQEENSRVTTYEGTGLGMAITKELVDLLGGTITVESEQGTGSTFEVILTLPLQEVKAEAVDAVQVQQEFVADGRKYHVLLAEDNDLNREIMEFLLQDANITYDSVANGVQAVEAFTQSQPQEYDCILMDVMMPDMNGYEATAAIRALQRPDAQTIPIFAMTANAYDEDRKKSLEAGMNAHLTKPIVIADVLDTIHTWCDKGRTR